MKQRLFQFFILGTLPWIFLIALIVSFLASDVFFNGDQTNWKESAQYTYGIQAFTCLITVLFLFSVIKLGERAFNPIESLISQISKILLGPSSYTPKETGLEDIDEIISTLYAASNDSRRRLDSERTLAADVSHQLRSPLTALSLRMEQIASDTRDTRVHEDAVAALGQIDRLVKLVESLLTTWRSTTDRDLSPIDVKDFLTESVGRWQTRFAAAGRSLKLEVQPGIVALGTRDVQDLVISVLLENSLQHGAGQTEITAWDYQSWVLIEVSDEGEGISEEIRSSLMSQGSTTSGSGLGLAWARNQVASDGGRLELRKFKPAVFGIFLIAGNHVESQANFELS